MLWGFVIGAVLGGLAGGWPGALVLGLVLGGIGWLVQHSNRRAAQAEGRDEPADRVAALERRVAALERKVSELQGAPGAPSPAEEAWEETRPFEPAPEPQAEPEPVEAPVAAPEPVFARPVEPPAPAPTEPRPIAPPPIEPRPIEPRLVEPPPVAPGPTEVASRGLIDRLLEGNIVAKLGVVILFFGVAFLLKFAYDRGFFPPGLRLFAVAAASLAMLFIGWRLLEKRRTYALVLVGGAMGLLYLDVYFALKTFGMIGPAAGFALFALLGVATLSIAVRLDARAVAALGLLGGFMAPVLASTGSGQHIVLFSYYLLLNGVILGASWFRSWRELNFIGFLFTFAIALLWGHFNYRPELFAEVEPFLVAFFLLYLAIPILFAHRQPPELRGVVDATLIFGVPLSTAMMQAALTRGMGDSVLAWSAALAAAVYAVLARVLWNRPNMRLLAQAHLALAIVFGTVAPYFAFDGYPTFAFWTIEGAAIFWIGARQGSGFARAFALLLQVAAAAYFWHVSHDDAIGHWLWNPRVVGCALIAAAAIATAALMRRFAATLSELERSLEPWILAWALGWAIAGAQLAVWAGWDGMLDRLGRMLLFIAAATTAAEYAGRRLGWERLRLVSLAHVPLMAAIAGVWLMQSPVRLGPWASHPLQGMGVLAWPIALALHFHIVHRQLRDEVAYGRALRYDAAWVLLVLLATWEAAWRHLQGHHGWVWAIGAAGLAAAALRFRLREHGIEGAQRRSGLVVAWALVWWYLGLHGLVDREVPRVHEMALHLGTLAASTLLFELVGTRLAWRELRRAQVLLPAGMLVAAWVIGMRNGHPFAQMQALAWAAAYAVFYFALRRQERDAAGWMPQVQHVVVYALAFLLLAWESDWQLDRARLVPTWHAGAYGLLVAAAAGLATAGLRRAWWPFASHAGAFRAAVLAPLMVLAVLWTLQVNVALDGGAPPLPYLPVLNPLDLAQWALFAAAVAALRHAWPEHPARDAAWKALGVLGFYWLNMALLRTVHHWADVPYALGPLLESVVAQAALSLLWTVTALALMFAAGRRASRPLWMAGAALLAVVVVKLFVNDLGNTGTVARIVTFIGVGVFMLAIGYLSPVPPRRTGDRA